MTPVPLGIGILSDDIERQRQAFLAAEAALARGDGDQVRDLVTRLHPYPLYPYLRYAELDADLRSATPEAVGEFLSSYAETPLAEQLRLDWLDLLAERGHWHEYLVHYRPGGSTTAQCNYLRAKLATGDRTAALAQVAPLWLVGRSQPRACDPVLDAWREAGHLTTGLVWRRIELAMAADDRQLATYLGRFLPTDGDEVDATGERTWLERWLAVDRDPRLIEDPDLFALAHPQRSAILTHGIIRLANDAPRRAVTAWDIWRKRIPFGGQEAAAVDAALGLALARVADDRALDYLDRVTATPENLPFQEQRLRVALAQEDWPKVAAWIDRMPGGIIKDERWLYWRARADEAMGLLEPSRLRFLRAAWTRGFWGFLAADRMDMPYNLSHRATQAQAALQQLIASPALRRIEELAALGREADLRREWSHFVAGLDGEDLEAAALIAHYLGWPDRTIRVLARGGHWDDMALRFPVLYEELVRREASATDLPASWIFAVIRQESAFAPHAGSQAGAVGLMQLMPATARWIAKRLARPIPSRTDLLDPQTNLALGAGYLAYVNDFFDDHPVLATAAYNAGPGRVRQWLPERAQAADIWIATIPFPETRNYVQRVLAYRIIYADRLGVADGPLADWLQPIGRAPAQTSIAADRANDDY